MKTAAAAAAATEGEKKCINPELWHSCAGPLVTLPPVGTHVVYFPQGHSEQVAASMKKDVDAQIPNYPNLPSKLLCLLHSVTLHADPETDEVYAQMTLQPVSSFDKDVLVASDIALKSNKPQTEFFCKTLTASDTSTHGGFSVPRRAAEKIFPQLDYTMQPPAQELVARDLHDNVWPFRHIYRGQPKRHLLTTGWSLFVSGKRLFAGDSVLFIRDEKQQLLLGIRRANRQPTNLSSSVLSSDSMHIGILAAAAHAATNNSPFTVFYNPRASPSEFVIPLAKYYRAVYGNQLSLGMRFRMMFETEESGTRRYMGTITGISDLDPVRWKNSQWRNLQVGWDESTAGERRNRVSLWEIEPVQAPFFICPPPFFRSKRPRQPGMPDEESLDLDNLLKRTMPWIGDEMSMKDNQGLPGLSLIQWMNMQQNGSINNSMQQPNYMHHHLSNLNGADLSRQMGLSIPQNNIQFGSLRLPQQADTAAAAAAATLSSVIQPQQQQATQSLISQSLPSSTQYSQSHIQAHNILQAQSSLQNYHHLHRNLPQNLMMQQQQQQQQQIMGRNQQQNVVPSQSADQLNQQLQMTESQIQLQLLQKLQKQQQELISQQQVPPPPPQLSQLQHPPQSFSRSTQMQEMPQALPQPLISQQQFTQNNSQTNLRFSHQQPTSTVPEMSRHAGGLPPTPTPTPTPTGTNQLSTAVSSMLTGAAGGGQSAITDDVPSRSTSPSTNNCSNGIANNSRGYRSAAAIGEDIAQSAAAAAAALLSPSALSANAQLVKCFQHRSDIKPSVSFPKTQNQPPFPQQTYLNVAASQMDYLDTSSSATSACLSQNDNNNNHLNFNSQSLLFRDVSHDGEVRADPRNNITYESSMDDQIGMPLISDPLLTKDFVGSGGGMIANFENSKEAQQELSSSMVSQSFGVPDIAFNSIDSSTINDNSFLSRGAWAPPPQFQRMRTFTKVYKRGAVGRSIDITRYSGYDELKQDLARRFGIEGQLEDQQRIGWKLVYVDHENDVLLVGDDPWEEFVNCVRCIKILSPQEEEQMSLDGDFGNNALPNQACSSSDGANA